MNKNKLDKKYESFKIPDRHRTWEDRADQSIQQSKSNSSDSVPDGMYYEIEYGSYPIPGVGRYVLKPQKIEEPKKDQIRDIFEQMRDIARAHNFTYDYSRFFDRRIQHDNETIFYKQGMFMKDFTDNYSGNTQFSKYFPYYQMMGYEQLRTYFTWRTEVRKGNVSDTSLSYAFLYIYELLGNIGVNDPQEGLDKLVFFWKAFSNYNKAIEKYVLRWLKDYHIYYELPHSFKEFIEKNNLTEHYPRIADSDNSFDLFCSISKYDIRKSAFFTDEKAKLIKECFNFVTSKLRQVCIDNEINFDELIFQPTKKMSVWIPFKDALFYQWVRQPSRRVVLSENEIYICSQNQWTFNTVITSESGRQLVGYIMKQTEAVLRKATKYKFKLSANINTVSHTVINKLNESGFSLENIVSSSVMEFYREATKTVVKVDQEALSIIRQEALATQEKLIVPEQEELNTAVPISSELSLPKPQEMYSMSTIEAELMTLSDSWEGLKNALSESEMQALSVVLYGKKDIKEFADECGIMPEVLIDGINEKAIDFIGDNLMDEEFDLYDDYIEQVKEMVE